MTTDPSAGRVAEGALALVTLVATVSFARLFDDGDALVPLLVAAVAAHLVTAGARRRWLGPGATAAIMGAGFALQASVTLYPYTSLLGLPTAATLTAVGVDLDQAWQLYGEVTAPAPASRGFLLAVTFTLWVTAALSDWAAFRLRAVAEAVVPALALFTYTSILAQSSDGVVLAAALVAAVLGFAVAQRVAGPAEPVGGRDRNPGDRAPTAEGSSALVRVGLATAVVCAVLAALVGPRLPGSGSEALVDLTAGDGPTSRMTVSPLVDIRSRLVQQSDAVAFRVTSERSAYWRLTSLDRFDGQVWSSSGSFSKADGRLPSVPPDAATVPVRQTFRIESLATIWAPAALTPVDLGPSDTELRWNGELATLIVPTSRDSIDRATYTVTSAVPELTPDDLGAPLPAALEEQLADATRLPSDITPLVASQARAVVSGVGPRPYDRAIALQDWFRSTFTYDLAGTGSGHDEAAIETFLEARRGYCEQFAGTFAAMARSLGIPARVAVGFTPGEREEDGTFTVRGRNAHAWPEVHIPGAGWVPFEPTPGRGQPGTEAYTGVPPAQATEDDAGAAPTTTTTPPTTASPAPTTPQGERQDLEVGPASADRTSSDRGARPLAVLAALVLLALVVLVIDVGGLAAVRALRRRRRRDDHTVVGRVRAAWADAVDALTRAGVAPLPAETDREFAARAAPDLGPDGGALTGLAGLATTATWARAGAPSDPRWAAEATDLARRVTARARAGTDRRQRIRALVDPRPLLAPRRRP